MKRYQMLIVVCILLTFMCVANAETMYVHVGEGTFLNGRHDPKIGSAVEMRLHRGDEVTVLSIDGSWAQIEGGEAGTAWCFVEYLASYPPDTDAPLYTVVSNGRVRVRQSPDGKTVGYVYDGNRVEVRFVMDGWAYIGNGYVMAEYLRVWK